MISERRLAERMESYWSELTPHLAALVRRLNLSGYEQDTAFLKSEVEPRRMFLVSEVAYKTLVRNYPQRPSADLVVQDAAENAEDVIRRFIDAAEQSSMSTTLSQVEVDFATTLAQAIHTYLALTLRGAPVQFAVPVRGHGFVNNLEMDATSADTLFEFKATERPLSSSDLRQVLIYLTLSHFDQRSFRRVALFNARRGRSYTLTVRDLILGCSGVSEIEFFHRGSDVFQRLLLEEQN